MTEREGWDWDGRAYHRIADPMTAWEQSVLDRLALRGDEVVMDAGCGSGRVTRMLLERVPAGRVYAVDRSPSMLAAAAEALAELADRAVTVEGDLTTVTLPEPVDLIFSTATFHWIPDHDALFAHLRKLLRPGGRLVAQCGGGDNIRYVMGLAKRAARRLGLDLDPEAAQRTWNYATTEETEARLARLGFVDVRTWMQPEPVTFPTREAYGEYLRTVILHPYFERLPEEAHAAFTDAVVAVAADDPRGLLIDYERLNMEARRP
jgi:trans-aconitate 2-methyltransferase